MDQPTFDPTPRARSAAGHRMSAAVLRVVARLVVGSSLAVSVAGSLSVAGGVALFANAAHAGEADGPIVIAGPNEQNPAALAALAEHMQATPAKRTGSAATLAAATAQSLGRGPSTRDADPFARAANASGSIVIAGAGETPAAPQMIRTNFKPDANGVVTIPAPGRGGSANLGDTASPADAPARANVSINAMQASRRVVPVVVTPAPPTNSARDAAGVQPVAVNAPSSAMSRAAVGVSGTAASADSSVNDGFETLASRGEPPQFGADGKPVAQRSKASANSTNTAAARVSATRAVASAVAPAPAATVASAPAQQNPRTAATTTAATAAQPAPLPGQQDPEAIRAVALAFLQQQSAGLPGKVDITVAPAFPRGLAACMMLEPFMPSGARLWGRVTVGVRCAGQRPWTIYLQARVSLHATYYLAGRAMSAGEVLTAADLVAREGDLTGLPQAIVTDPSQALGSVTLTRVSAGMPLRRDMLKSASAVSIGQTVRVVAAGDGFAISAEGSAMNNASPGQQVRVKTANGQVISGIVKDGSTVEIQL
ncbi:flagellar basal body P-ring formation chaperone FlgA [Paraburkholderia graminis]|uniref:Flagella basal body P-ring formation protein FlgA n=1 Tax=Paraburkholderia graminis TaxID=60548 RepID=A0ABD5CAD5_9BURK|nr:flagellar basal body P-ring formation chaperone FlgA [Paraburkholderia graminis]MDQ0621103.1 flagella basal body P-ring formation protein FlgA [Paraburkholderia graminis]MDR6202238.1 flagella basal body P-ring formation protein FlgA [Paraburkholderia graminis]